MATNVAVTANHMRRVGSVSDFQASWLGVRVVTTPASDVFAIACDELRLPQISLLVECDITRPRRVVSLVLLHRRLCFCGCMTVCVCIYVCVGAEVFSSGAWFPGIFTPRGRRVTLARVWFGGRNTAPPSYSGTQGLTCTHSHAHTYTHSHLGKASVN